MDVISQVEIFLKLWDICEILDNFESFLFSTIALTINIFVVTIIRFFY